MIALVCCSVAPVASVALSHLLHCCNSVVLLLHLLHCFAVVAICCTVAPHAGSLIELHYD